MAEKMLMRVKGAPSNINSNIFISFLTNTALPTCSLSLSCPITFIWPPQTTTPKTLQMFIVGEAMLTPKYLSSTLLNACITKVDEFFMSMWIFKAFAHKSFLHQLVR